MGEGSATVVMYGWRPDENEKTARRKLQRLTGETATSVGLRRDVSARDRPTAHNTRRDLGLFLQLGLHRGDCRMRKSVNERATRHMRLEESDVLSREMTPVFIHPSGKAATICARNHHHQTESRQRVHRYRNPHLPVELLLFAVVRDRVLELLIPLSIGRSR